jgi:hypothetical protein
MKAIKRKAVRHGIISADDIIAKRRELVELEAAFDQQEMDKLVRAARSSCIDLSHFSEAQVAEALRGLQRAFSGAVVPGEPPRADEDRPVVDGKAKASASG